MLRYRIVVAVAVFCSLVGPPLSVRADLPPEMILGPQDSILSSSAVKSLQRAPLTIEGSKNRESRVGLALGQQTLESIADTCILEGRPTQNFGDSSDMWVGYDDDQAPYVKTARSFVLFDTSAIPGNAAIISATLRLYLVNSWDYEDEVRTVTTYRVPSSWSETGLTWDNAPQPAEAHGDDDVKEGDFRWYEFDVTDLVSAWQRGTYANHGIMIRAPEVSGQDSSRRGFSSREGAHPPQLVFQTGKLLFLPLTSR